jgi:hypothetical protein
MSDGSCWGRGVLAPAGLTASGTPVVLHVGEEQLVVADPRQPGSEHGRRPGIGRFGGAVVPGLAPAQAAVPVPEREPPRAGGAPADEATVTGREVVAGQAHPWQ